MLLRVSGHYSHALSVLDDGSYVASRRLQSMKTVKFIKNFVTFLALFIGAPSCASLPLASCVLLCFSLSLYRPCAALGVSLVLSLSLSPSLTFSPGKHNGALVISSIDAIQGRLFRMVLESLWLPHVQKVGDARAGERKRERERACSSDRREQSQSRRVARRERIGSKRGREIGEEGE